MAICPECKEKVRPKSHRAKLMRVRGLAKIWTCPKCEYADRFFRWRDYQKEHQQELIDKMKIDLIPCPFCGSKAKFIKHYTIDGGTWCGSENIPSQVKCTRKSCGASIIGEKLESTKKWNKRK